MAVTLIVAFDRFPEIMAALPGRVKQLAADYAAGDLLPAERAGAPVDTGALQASGNVQDRGDAVAVVFTGGAVNRSGEARVYAAFVEYGTRFTPAQPFALPAVEATFPEGVYARAQSLIE